MRRTPLRRKTPLRAKVKRLTWRGKRKTMDKPGNPLRLRSPEHMRFVAQHPCCVTGRFETVVHHLTHVQPKARGLKAGDQWTVPLWPALHRELHDWGDEADWWARRGLDPVEIALDLAERSACRKVKASVRQKARERAA